MWTSPITWTDNDTLSSETLNEQIKQNLIELYNPPYVQLFNNANQTVTVTSEVYAPVVFNTVDYQTHEEFFDFDIIPTRIYLPQNGIYIVNATVLETSVGQDWHALQITHNGTPIAEQLHGVLNAAMSVATVVKASANDYIEVWYNHDDSTTRTLTSSSNYAPRVSVVYIGDYTV